MQRHKRVLPLMAAFFVWLSILQAPYAAAASWPAALGDTENSVLFTQPNGSVTVGGCLNGTYEQRMFSAAGAQTSSLKQLTEASRYVTCDYQSDTAPDGTTYTLKVTDTKQEVVAVKAGQVVGKPVRVSNLCSTSDTGNVLGLRYSGRGIYALIESANSPSCASRYTLAKVDVQAGRVVQRVAVSNSYAGPGSLQITRQYLVVHGDQTINYVPFDLSAKMVSVKFEARSWTGARVATTFDSMSYVAHTATNPSSSCGSTSSQYDKITSYNEHNPRPIWTYKLPACALNVQVHAAPFDMLVLQYKVVANGAERHEVVALSINGVPLWQPHVFSAKTLQGHNYVNDSQPFFKIDNNGNIVARRIYWYTPGNYHMVAFQFVSLFSGKLTDEYLTEKVLQPGESTAVAAYSVGLTHGRLYFSMKQKLYMLPVARMGMEYLRAGVYGIEPEPIRDALYVALGDSFSSGEGVPPFTNTLPMCHQSGKAFPRLLHSDLEAMLTLSAFGACSGAVTDDVVNTIDGRAPAHGLPLQESMLGSGVKVVTITIGGNDVEFEKYAKSCVATLSPLGSCGTGSAQYQKTMDIMKNHLPSRLDKVYARIKSKAFNAKVYVLGYPQLVPVTTIAAYPGTCRYLDDTERFAVRNVVTSLNYQLSKAVNRIKAQGGNFEFVPVDQDGSPFLNHELCTDSAYFNGLSFPPEHSFHPNVLGHSAYAEVIKEAIVS